MKTIRQQHLKTLAITSILAVSAASCAQTTATHGQVILPSRLAQIQPGSTTQPQVLQLLGTPSTTGSFDQNRWYYVTSTNISKPLNPNILKSREVIIIDFDPSGTVVALNKKTEADGKQVDPATKTTPTHGQTLGIVDQMLGNIGLGAQ